MLSVDEGDDFKLGIIAHLPYCYPGLDIPFLLLPFRPSSDPSSARTFIRHYFSPPPERPAPLRGEHLVQELRLTEPMVRDT